MANFTPYLTLAWILVVLCLFPVFKQHRAVLVAVLLGLLFLPEVGSQGGGERGVAPLALGPLHFTKDLAVNYALLFAVLAYDWRRVASFRPRWIDVPLAVWCLCPLASALTNDPPPDGSWAVRDGLSQSWQLTMTWGVPYLLGRLYFTDVRALRDLALGAVIAAAVYAPLCLLEVRLSPQLHSLVYGFSQHSFVQTIRYDGYRPMVFFKHGLTLSLWMTAALVLGGWIWWAGQRKAPADRGSRPGVWLGWSLLLLLPTVVLLKSTGALALGLLGTAALCLSRVWPSRVWLVLLVVAAPLYVAVRTSAGWSGEGVVEAVSENLGADRAQSLDFRLRNEDRLIGRALERPVFGWGGWGRARVFDERGRDTTVTDGLWIIALGDRGFVGLAAVGAVLLLPAVRFVVLFKPESWSRGDVAPLAACAVVLVLWGLDSLMNAGFNHFYLILAGSLAGLNPATVRGAVARAPARRRRRRVRGGVLGVPVTVPSAEVMVR
jgi:hypothetical protein